MLAAVTRAALVGPWLGSLAQRMLLLAARMPMAPRAQLKIPFQPQHSAIPVPEVVAVATRLQRLPRVRAALAQLAVEAVAVAELRSIAQTAVRVLEGMAATAV